MFTKTVKNVLITTSLIGGCPAMDSHELKKAMEISLQMLQQDEQHKKNKLLQEQRLENEILYDFTINNNAKELNIDPIKYEQLFIKYAETASELNMEVHEYIKMRVDDVRLEKKRTASIQNPQNKNLLPNIDFGISEDPIKRKAYALGYRHKEFSNGSILPDVHSFNDDWKYKINLKKDKYNQNSALKKKSNIKFILEDSSFDNQIHDQFLEKQGSGGRNCNCLLYSIIRNDEDLLAKILGSRGEAQRLIQIQDENNRDYQPVRKAIIDRTKANLNTEYLGVDGKDMTLRIYLTEKFHDSEHESLRNTHKSLNDKLTDFGNSGLMFESYFADVISVLYDRPIYVLTPAFMGQYWEQNKDPYLLVPMNRYVVVMPDRNKNGQDAIFVYHAGPGHLHYEKLIPIKY